MIGTILRFLSIDKLITWLRPTLEGEDGKSSARRMTSLLVVFLYIIGHIHFFKEIKDAYWLIRLILIDATFICVLFSIINLQQLLTFFIKVKSGAGVSESLDVETPKAAEEPTPGAGDIL